MLLLLLAYLLEEEEAALLLLLFLLLLEFERERRPRQSWIKGCSVGRQAQVMPIESSTADQMRGRTYDQVTSVWSMLMMAQTRTMAAPQMLLVGEWC